MTPRIGLLVDVSWLADRLGSQDLRIVDCRWYLEDPAGGRSAYQEGHIPGARYVPLEPDMTASTGPGRHPLPAPVDFVDRLGATGIGDEHAVVAYDDRGGAIASATLVDDEVHRTSIDRRARRRLDCLGRSGFTGGD